MGFVIKARSIVVGMDHKPTDHRRWGCVVVEAIPVIFNLALLCEHIPGLRCK